MTRRQLVILPALVATIASAAAAQSVTGHVLLADSATAAPGIVVTALDENGATVARAISARSGQYFLKLPRPGQYELHALRIGFQPTILRGVVVPGVDATRLDMVVLERPVVIAGQVITSRDDCGLHGQDATMFSQLWDQARSGLAAVQLSAQSGRLDVRVVRFDGMVDKDGQNPFVDSAHAQETIADRVFATTSPETLSAAGYVRELADGRLVYDMPSADAILSDNFVGEHCFHLEQPPRDHPDWIGISFSPTSDRDEVVDLAGTLWLDRNSAELRTLDFRYTNLRQLEDKVCGFLSGGSVCQRQRGDPAAGGYVNFVRLSSGEWLANRWMIRTPVDTLNWRYAGFKISQGPDGKPVHSRDIYANRVYVATLRRSTMAGTIASVSRDGAEIYRHDSTLAFVARTAAKRAGSRPASFDGVVTDGEGHPLVRAIVQTEDPARAAITDSSGFFQIRVLPSDPINVQVRCTGYAPVRFRLPLLRDSTRHISLKLVADEFNPVLTGPNSPRAVCASH